ncbi:MAG: hypothetical protein IPM29_08415 [Planctomycetes bacterium]|nr:hypothetical protein [Planctomycetota bacterium]
MQREAPVARLLIDGSHAVTDRVRIAPAGHRATSMVTERDPTRDCGGLTRVEGASLVVQLQTAPIVPQKSSVTKQREDATDDACRDPGELLVGRCRQRVEGRAVNGGRHDKDAVDEDLVKVRVEPEGRVMELCGHHRRRPRLDDPELSRLAALQREVVSPTLRARVLAPSVSPAES